MSGRIDELVREAREELGRREAQQVDWDAVDRGLFARIREEERAERDAVAAGAARGRWWALGGAALAAAAAFAVMVGKTREPRPVVAQVSAEASAGGGGAIVAFDGPGQLLVDGIPAVIGTPLHPGDVIEARDVVATIERPGVTYDVERGTRATVERTPGRLVLALDVGAVEAQVAHVDSGEAFAVDVGRSRVAVHGTHLRVARHGDAVTVDLSEGVVLVGETPRVGSTVGALVTAPAHAEFGASAAEQTLTVSHDPANVRTPMSLGPNGPIAVASPLAPPAPLAPPPVAAPLPPSEPHAAPAAVPPPHGDRRAAVAALPLAPAAAAPSADPNAEATVADAVRTCLAACTRHVAGVSVIVSTTLHLDLGDDGAVRAAKFDPPVAADVNACAAPSIYKTRFTHGGAVVIPVDLKVPLSAP